MISKQRTAGLHPAWWTLILVSIVAATAVLTGLAFNRDLQPYASVTLISERAGLVMEPYAKVKYRGVQVGRVASIQPNNPVTLRLQLDRGQLKYIPANVAAQITAPTAFGSKFVELVAPADPSPKRLTAGTVLRSRNVSIEVNTVFQNLVGVLNQVDTAKLSAVLSALAEGVRGKGQALGDTITDLNQVLLAINPRNELIRADYRSLKAFSDALSATASDIVTVLDAASTTSFTISTNKKSLDSLLLNAIGFSDSGINLIGTSRNNLVKGINGLEPTTRLLMKYNPMITCTLVGGKIVLETGLVDATGGRNGKSLEADSGVYLGDDVYTYPDNLPVLGQKGGPGGAPSCGSLPDVANNWPVRYVVTNSGWGTGLDLRPNPGIGFPGYVDYYPVTRGIPEPPSLRHPGGPAPGPVPYPGAPPYGAPWYAPDGKPLYPGLPPAPPPGRPREPGKPPAGSEPFTPAYPAQVQPTHAFQPPPAPRPLPPPPHNAPTP
jgi:phospholipid/cholesterol/gamma-HCH transport system substrate-binding protein